MYNIKDGEDKNMSRETEFTYRLNCILKRCKQEGKWDLLSSFYFRAWR